jgi:hypothetical protein
MRAIVVLTTALLVACGALARATVLIPADVSELSRDAVAIARGVVVSVDGQWTAGRRSVETIVTLAVEAYLKGQMSAPLRFRVPGGSLGQYRNIVVGAPTFSVGQRIVVFLGARGATIPHLLGLGQGVYRLSLGHQGQWLVTPPPILPTSVGRVVRGSAARRPVPLVDFERDVRALAGVSR